MSGATAESGPVVATATLVWRDADGAPWTTLVAKLTARLLWRCSAALVAPVPIVPFDRVSADPSAVDVAGEMFPFTSGAAVLLASRPLRVTLVGAHGSSTFAAVAGQPLGPSMSAPERRVRAPSPLTRAADGVLELPRGLDPRYFVAARDDAWLPALRGDEQIVLETPARRVEGALPGIAMVARVSTGSSREKGERLIAPAFDLLVIDGDAEPAGRISLVGRACVRGAVVAASWAIGPLERLTTSDRGDDPLVSAPRASAPLVSAPRASAPLVAAPHEPSSGARRGPPPEAPTEALSPEAIAALRNAVATPFEKKSRIDSPLVASLAGSKADARGPRTGSPPVFETEEISSVLLRARPAAIPFVSSQQPSRAEPPSRAESGSRPAATPFEAGFQPVAVAPASDADETLAPMGVASARLGAEVRAWLETQRGGGAVAEEPTVAADGVAPVPPARFAPPNLVTHPSPPPVGAPLPAAVAASPPGDPSRATLLARLDAGERLTGAKLAGQDLRGLALAGVWLDGADLSGADLRGVDLQGARLGRVKLDEARLDDAKLDGAALEDASVRGAHLGGASFARTTLDRASFDAARGSGVNFAEARGTRVSFASAQLPRSIWRGAQLADALFERAVLHEADFEGAALSGLRGASLDATGGSFIKAQLVRADLSGANLACVRGRQADLSEADLERADLHEAELHKAQLTGAKLGRARLDGAQLDGARLSKADLRGASAAGTSFDDAQLEGASLRELRAPGATFQRALLRGAGFERAEVPKGSFDEADARAATFRNAKLAGARLMRARLGEADLRDADLTGADLTGADQTGARLRGAKTKDAKGVLGGLENK